MSIERLPPFLRPTTTIDLSSERRFGAPSVAAAPSHLDFKMQIQQRTRWCWAAVGASVSSFFDAASPWTQCGIVNACLDREDCCGNAAGGDDCNQDGYLDKSLDTVSALESWGEGATAFDAVSEQIGRTLPLGCRIGWFESVGGGGHFVVVAGCRDAGARKYLDVADPPDGTSSQVEYTTFCAAYKSAGSWSHSYFTKR